MPTQVEEAAEAICGALSMNEFEFIGESETGLSTWFTRGEPGRNMRVQVLRSDPMILMKIEYADLARRHRFISIQINAGSNSDRWRLQVATEQAVFRCLEVYRDILQGTGVVVPELHLPPTTDSV